MRIYITGNKGQLGRALEQALAQHTLFGGDLPEVDITDLASIRASIGEAQPEIVIHSAALTDVDGCARKPDLAYRVNALGTRNVAVACQDVNCALLAISTNEVFDGAAAQPYLEFDSTRPINPYAQSKLAAEVFVRDLSTHFYIVRTAWLFGYGGNNFVTKIIKRAQADGQLRVVADEVSSPTFAPDLSRAIARLIETGAYGIYHFVNDGACSRFEFAQEILRQSGLAHVPIEPTRLADLARPSTPPGYTPLRNFCGAQIGITLRRWQDALAEYIANEKL
ncbi:MAG TPA: dTDP-4-dehydrorhamnose reductase [Anaerolineae bacterium]|nr:dTDP-4-dehydrorhamnose reductase [Anaerolineae bacterium]